MADLWAALCLVAVLEGLVLFAVPGAWKRTIEHFKAQTRRPRVTRENDEFEPIQGPPTGFSTGKEQRLKELLDRYMADEVTPDQYHAERAKILAEP